MATEKLHISGWDSGWETGILTNVDEYIASADGQTVSTTIVDNIVIFDIENTSILDTDVVSEVLVTIRTRSDNASSGQLHVNLLENGFPKGLATTAGLTTSFTNEILTNTGWDQDFSQSQLNSLQVRVESKMSGGPATLFIDCIDVDITFTPGIFPPAATLVLAGQAPTQRNCRIGPTAYPASGRARRY